MILRGPLAFRSIRYAIKSTAHISIELKHAKRGNILVAILLVSNLCGSY